MTKTSKRVLSWLLTFVMLFALLPAAALAAGTMVIRVDTSSYTTPIEVGTQITLPVVIDSNDGFAVANVGIDYDTDVFTIVEITNGDIAGDRTAGADNFLFVDNDGANNTATGILFNVKLEVKADAPAGSTSISAKCATGYDDDIADENGEAVSVTFTPGTVTIAGEVPAALTFVDGVNTYDYDTIKADNYTLTAPGAGYYFAGWFAGLTADGTMIVNEDGRYVLSSIDTADLTSITATELRPKYEDAPEAGEYHALWVHENDTNPTVMVLEVYENSVIYRKASFTDAEKEIITTNDVIRSAWTHLNGTGRLKLVKDLTTDNVCYKGSAGNDYLDYPLKIDLNGRTLTGSKTSDAGSYYSGGGVLYFRGGSQANPNCVESSHGQGKLYQTHDYKYGAPKVFEVTSHLYFQCIRDVDLEGHYELDDSVGLLIGQCEVGFIKNVNINVTGPAGSRAVYSSNTNTYQTHVGYVDNLNITTNQIILDADNVGCDFGTITNCTWTSTATDVAGINNKGLLTFGAGNTVTTDSNALFVGTGELRFTADGYYSAAEGGNPLEDSIKVTQTPVAGQVAYNDNGRLAFGEGFTLTYMNHDGTQILWTDSYLTGETPADNRSLTYPIDHVNQYTFDGWGTAIEGGVIDVTALSADTTLYAQRTLTTLPAVVIRTVGEFEPEYFNLWEDAVDIPTRMGADNALTWGKAVTLQFQQDATIGSSLRGGYYKVTYDLNGHTVTYTGAKDFYIDGSTSADSSFTLTSTTTEKGTLIITGNAALIANSTSKNQDGPFTLNNVCVEAANFQPANANNTSLSTYSTPSGATGLLTFFNSGTGATAVYTLNMTDTELYCPNAPAIDYYVKNNSANAKMLMTLANCQIEGGSMAINIRGVNGANPVITLTADKDCTFKNAAGTDPIKTAAGDLKLKTTYPTGYAYKAIGEGWYGFVPQLSYNDGADKTVDGADPVITETTVESITVKNAESLGRFHSLTVKNDGVELVFSAEALQSIASAATGDVVLTLKKTAAVEETELTRVQLTLTSGGNPVAFTGAVDVTVKGLSFGEGEYAVYYVNGAELEMIASAIDKTAGTAAFTTTHFSDYAIKSVAGYTVTVNPDKTDYNAGETVTVEYKISKSEATELNGFQFKLAYDDTKLELVSLTVGSDFTGGEMKIDGAYVAGTMMTPVEINSTEKLLATATFTVKSTIPTFTTDSLTLTGMYFKNAGFDKDIEGVIAPVTVNLHNLKITLKSDGHGTINGAKDDVVLYAQYGETGLYSDEARTTAASITEGVDYGYQLLDKHWIDNAATPVEWADFAAIAGQTFNGEQADVYTLQTVQQVSIQIDTAQNATTSDTFTNPIVTTKGTKLGDVAGIPNYTPNDYHTADGWYVSTDAGETYTKLAVAKTDDAFRNYVVNGNIKLYYKAVPASYTYTSNVAEKTLTGITEKEGIKYATYGTEVVATFESDDSKIIDKVSVKIGDAAATEEYSSNAAGVWTVKIPAASVTGDITVEVTTKDIYTITFTNGTGVKPLSATAYVISGVPTYYASVAELKAATSTFTIPAPEADTGYRLADQSGEKLWKIGEDGFTASELAGKTYTTNATVTAQAVKTFVVTFDAGEHGTIAATQITVDKDSTVEAALTSAPAVTAEAGYEFTEWSPKTGTITADTTITAQYQDAKYDLTLSAPTGVTVEATAGEEGGKVTHGTDAVIKVSVPEGQKVTEISYFVDGVEHTVTLAEPISGPADYSFTIPGAEITGPVSVVVKGNATKVVTFKAGANGTVGGGASVTKVYDVGASIAAADLPAVKANAGYKFDKWDKEPTGFQVTESATEADLTFTATFTDASYSLTEDGKQKPDVTHGTDYTFTPNPDEGVVVGVVVTVEDEDGNPVPITPVKNDDGSYTIPGDKITGPVVITYQTVNGAFRFIDYDTYRALDTDTKIAVLETAFQDGKNYSLDGYRIAYYSDGEGYKGYIWIVDDSETVASLSAKLSVTDGTAAEKITYQDGDLNDSSLVTATDAGIINDVLRHVATVYTVSDQLRFELDILGDGAVTTQDIMWVLNKAIEVAKG